MTSKGLTRVKPKLANCSWIITKWGDVGVTGRLLPKNRPTVRFI